MALRSVPSAARISYEARAEEVSMENKLAGMNLGSSRLSFEPARFSAMVGSHSGGNLAAGENAVAEYQAWKVGRGVRAGCMQAGGRARGRACLCSRRSRARHPAGAIGACTPAPGLRGCQGGRARPGSARPACLRAPVFYHKPARGPPARRPCRRSTPARWSSLTALWLRRPASWWRCSWTTTVS